MPYIGQLGQGVRDIGTKITSNRKSENFNKIVNDPNATDIQIATAFSQLPKDIKVYLIQSKKAQKMQSQTYQL